MMPAMETTLRARLDRAFAEDAEHLRRLSYRLTGSVHDADDVVQETFARAAHAPPPDLSQPLRPWLVRVATNLARDRLRARRRRDYPGAWLPEPLSDVEEHEPSPEARYGLLESLSYAFLVALEVLSPTQRAVLVLRDVLDLPAREVAETLGTSEANVRQLHLRARRGLETYDRERVLLPDEAYRAAMQRLLACVAARDLDGLTALLVDDARQVSDAAGRYPANTRTVEGRLNVARLLLGLSQGYPAPFEISERRVNGQPAWLFVAQGDTGRFAPRLLVVPELAADGRIRTVGVILAPEKLSALDQA